MKKIKFKTLNKFLFEKKYVAIGIFLLLLIFVLFFVTKAYLYFHYLIGNDFVISLNTDKTNFFLKHNEQDKIVLKSQVFANPFCNLNCTSHFIDLGTGNIIDEKKFILKSAMQNIQEYLLSADKFGKGQDLYRFEIRCTNAKTSFCQTSEEEKSKKILITLNYDINTNEEKIKNQSKISLSLAIQGLDYMQRNLEEINKTFLVLFGNVTSNNFFNEINNVSGFILSINKTYFELKKLWENNEYSNLEKQIFNSEKNLRELETKFNLLNETVYNLTLKNNFLFDNFSYAKQKLEMLKEKNVSFNESFKIDLLIEEFNFIVSSQDNYSLIYDFIFRLENLSFIEQPCCFASKTINNITLSKIYLNSVNSFLSVDFLEPKSVCCFLENCSVCNDGSHNDFNYPIVFVHGHSFNHKVSAEYSFDTFEYLQEKLEKDGYINAGTIISISKEKGIFGLANYPFSFVASYYFDIYKNDKLTKIIQTKQDSIDSYAIRLNDIIKEVKSETEKDKVVIICHSMGGLVSRRYLQIFGENDVAKLIILGTPNHGISEKIYNYCKLFGSKRECDDMRSDSLLINKVNQSILKIPVYNIIGGGCDMDGQNGDGIVETSTAYLDFAKNYYVNGSCPSTFKFLHLDFVYPNKYPEVYEIIRGALKE